MPTQNQRRFPTLQSSKCSPKNLFCDSASRSGSREEELFSPPTLPYTFESVVENMNRRQVSTDGFGAGGSSGMSRGNSKASPSSTARSTKDNIFAVSPTSAGSTSKASTSSTNSARPAPKPPRMNPFCNGSYGHSQPKANAEVAVEDVIRWREFRRRQKEMSKETNEMQSDLPNLDSLTLSASNSSSGETRASRASGKSNEDGESASPRAIEIDQHGFPASPADSDRPLTAENVEAAANSSEAPTEVASNTLFSRLLASSERGGLGSVCETPSDPVAGVSSGGRKRPSSTTAPSPKAEPAASPKKAPPSTRSVSSAMSARSESSAPERFGGVRRSTSSTEEWDDTVPTLDVDALNESMEEEQEEGDKNDVSTVSSDWDPLHVTTIAEESGPDNDDASGGGDDEGTCNHADQSISLLNIHGEMGVDGDNIAKEEEHPAAAAQGAKDESPQKLSPDSSPTSTTDKSTSTSNKQRPTSPISCCSVPTLTEVKSFMNKLDSLREEQRTHHANRSKSTTTTCCTDAAGNIPDTLQIPPLSSQHSPPGVEIKEENVDYLRTLLEKKEKLRLHKLETQRKRNELDERLRAMRSKVYDKMNDVSMETTTTVDAQSGEQEDKIVVRKEEEVKVPVMPGARWSGGMAIWSSPGASPATMPEKEEETKEAIPCLPTDLSKDSKDDQVQKPRETETDNRRVLREPDWIKGPLLSPSPGAACKKTAESSIASAQPLKSPLHKAVESMTNIGAAHNASSTKHLCKSAQDSAAMTSPSFKSPLHKIEERTSRNDLNKPNAESTSTANEPPQKVSQLASLNKVVSRSAAHPSAKSLPNASSAQGSAAMTSPSFKSPLHKMEERLSRNDENKTNADSTSTVNGPPQKASQLASLNKVASRSATLSVALEKDDFSFKPSMLDSRQIPFSPLVAGKKSYVSKFSFSSPDINRSSSNISASAEIKRSPLSEVTNSASQSPPETSPPISSTSPDVSEGDKGGGIGFGYIFGDKSVVSKSSSRFVELGQFDSSTKESEDKEEQSLVGVTVVGSKEKKHEKRKKLDSPQFGTVDEQSKSSYRESEGSPQIVALDPPGVESCHVWQKNPQKDIHSKHSKKSSRDLTVDCSMTFTKDEIASNFSTENDDTQTNTTHQSRSTEPKLLSPVVESTTENDFDSVMQRFKAITTPRSSLETPRVANTASLKSPRFRAERANKISKVSSTIDALKSKFESEGVKVSPMKEKETNVISREGRVFSSGWTKPKSSLATKSVVKPFGMESTKMWSSMTKESNQSSDAEPERLVERKEFYGWTKPSSAFINHSKSDAEAEPVERKEFYGWTKPSPGFINRSKSNPVYEYNNSILNPTLSDVKEELTQVESMDNSSISSFKGLNIKELRLRFEGSKDSMSVDSIKKQDSFKSRELGTKASLESDADNDCADGGNSLDTKKVLSYAHRIEQNANKRYELRDSHPEVAKTTEAGSGETENSAKENMLDRAVDEVFPNFSPVAIRKKAFESRRKQAMRTALKPPENDGDVLQDAVLICQKMGTLSEQIEAKPAVMPKQQSTPRLSVRERVATFNSPVAVPTFNSPGAVPAFNHPGAYQRAVAAVKKNPIVSPRQVVPFQKLTPPPKIVETNKNQTPSPLWTHNQKDSIFSPMETIGAPKPQNVQRQRQSAPYALRAPSMNKITVNTPPMRQPQSNQQAYNQNQPRAIQASYDSPGLSQGDDDYDDGITLSPTCSEVSGLTVPTCLGSIADDNSKNSRSTSNFPDSFQDAMSPIARHRQKNGANTNGNLFNHPYLKRMISQTLPNAPTQKARGVQQVQQNQRSHREQILSRVIEKPSSPRRTQAAATISKPLPYPHKRKSNDTPSQPISVNVKPSPGRSKRMSNNLLTEPAAGSTMSHQSPHRTSTKHAGKGKVAERVAMVNERTNRANESSNQHNRRIARQSEDLSSAATRDCLRVN